ncbi:MAG: glycosyltransferase, partial [Geodermatophilaceae bacterium]|nr:glycosyltransferase [Geodermatophilaceae bacterium]
MAWVKGGVSQAEPTGVVAVVVTWNRAGLLTRSLSAILSQSSPPDLVVVVDNASTDETAAVLAEQFAGRVDVVTLARNLGGAGGFA